MNKSMVRQWVNTLRVGGYQQGQMKLRGTDNHYCCLGVVCDVFMPDKWGYIPRGGPWYRIDSDYGMSVTGSLNVELAAQLGITQDGGFHVRFELENDKDKWPEVVKVFQRFPGAEKAYYEAKDKVSRSTWDDFGYYSLSMVTLNDDLGFSFDEIADVLEAALELPHVFDFKTQFESWAVRIGDHLISARMEKVGDFQALVDQSIRRWEEVSRV